LGAAEALVERIAPSCVQVEIAGSLRRGMATVGDVEIVAEPRMIDLHIARSRQMDLFGNIVGGTPASTKQISQLDRTLETLDAMGDIFRERPYAHQKGVWGDKRKQFWLPVLVEGERCFITVDLYIVTPPAQWDRSSLFAPVTATLWAGWSDEVDQRAHTLSANRGRLIIRATGEEVQTPTEEAYFRALGLPYIEPDKRELAKMQKMFQGNETAESSVFRPFFSNSSQARDKTSVENKSAPFTDQVQPALSTRIKAALQQIDGLHPTVLVGRIGCCDLTSFKLAVSTLKLLGEVTEDRVGCLHLLETVSSRKPAPHDVRPSCSGALGYSDIDVRQAIVSGWKRELGLPR